MKSSKLFATRYHWVMLAGFLAAFVSCVTWADLSSAQDEEARANARAAAHAGADALDAGKYQEAITYFERAESQFHSPVHLWYIARAAKLAGQLVKAREACLKVRREGAGAGASGAVAQANQECADMLEEIEGSIATLTINVEGAPPGVAFKVFRNGQEVPSAIVGIPAPADPGQHKLSATAEGYLAKEQSITLEEGAKEAVTLTLEPSSQAASTGDGQSSSSAETDAESSGLPKPYWPAFTAWGVGLAGVGAGVYFGLSAVGKANEADEICGGSRGECRLDADSADATRVNELNNQAGTNQMLSLISYGAGGAIIATGVVLWLLEVGGGSSGKKSAKMRDLQPSLQPIVGPSHLGLRGSF